MPRDPKLEFDRLVEGHQSGVIRVCRSILRDDHLGLDAAQETFLRLWSLVRAGDLPEHCGAWLRRVAVRVSLDADRRRRASRSATERMAEHSPTRTAPAPGGSAEAGELRARLEAALPHLSDGQRKVFLLRHDAGLPLREIADLLGVALPTVKTQFARACHKLASELRSFESEERTR